MNCVWTMFSSRREKENFEFKKDVSNILREITVAFEQSPEDFKKFMEVYDEKINSYGRHIYESFFHNLLHNKNLLVEDRLQRKISDADGERIIENTLTFLFCFCKKHYKDETAPNYDNVNVEFLRNLRDIANQRAEPIDPDDWVWVYLFLNGLCNECMEHSFTSLNYKQINEIMNNFSCSEYGKYLVKYIDIPFTSYSVNEESEPQVISKMPVLWAMALNHEVTVQNEWQTPFEFQFTERHFKYPNIIEFLVNIESYRHYVLEKSLEYNELRQFDNHMIEPFYGHILMQVSLNEDENQKLTMELLDKGFGFYFWATNNISLSNYYNGLYEKTGNSEFGHKRDVIAAKEEELKQPKPEM